MIMVFDTSVLSCFARADRLDHLERLTRGSKRRVTTRAVIDEIERGISAHPSLDSAGKQTWLEKVAVDGIDELKHFAEFARRLVDKKGRNVGEASALAWAMVHGGVFFSDDQCAIGMAKEYGIETKRSLAIICRGIKDDILKQEEAGILVDELIGGGARFPCGGGEFLSWINQVGLFD